MSKETVAKLTEEQRENLAKLAVGLRTVKSQFDMRDFCREEIGESNTRVVYPYNSVDALHECGTTACAMGWAPTFLGETGYTSWFLYGLNVFGLNWTSIPWLFLFSDEWVDGTAAEAADRIEYFLENGVPERWMGQDFYHQTID